MARNPDYPPRPPRDEIDSGKRHGKKHYRAGAATVGALKQVETKPGRAWTEEKRQEVRKPRGKQTGPTINVEPLIQVETAKAETGIDTSGVKAMQDKIEENRRRAQVELNSASQPFSVPSTVPEGTLGTAAANDNSNFWNERSKIFSELTNFDKYPSSEVWNRLDDITNQYQSKEITADEALSQSRIFVDDLRKQAEAKKNVPENFNYGGSFEQLRAMYGNQRVPDDVYRTEMALTEKIIASPFGSDEERVAIEELRAFMLGQWSTTEANRTSGKSSDYHTWSKHFTDFEAMDLYRYNALVDLFQDQRVPNDVMSRFDAFKTEYVDALNAGDEARMAEISARANAFVEEQRQTAQANDTGQEGRKEPFIGVSTEPIIDAAKLDRTRLEKKSVFKSSIARLINFVTKETKERVDRSKGYLSERKKALGEKAKEYGESPSKLIEDIGEHYNTLSFKKKLLIGATFGIGATVFAGVSTPLSLLYGGVLMIQRAAGGISLYLKLEEHLQATTEGTSKNFLGRREWYQKLFKGSSERERKVMATLMAVNYTLAASLVIGGAMVEASESSYGQELHQWLRDHYPWRDATAAVAGTAATNAAPSPPANSAEGTITTTTTTTTLPEASPVAAPSGVENATPLADASDTPDTTPAESAAKGVAVPDTSEAMAENLAEQQKLVELLQNNGHPEIDMSSTPDEIRDALQKTTQELDNMVAGREDLTADLEKLKQAFAEAQVEAPGGLSDIQPVGASVHGYEGMLKELVKQLPDTRPPDIPDGSDIAKIYEAKMSADPKELGNAIHRIAKDSKHGFFTEQGSFPVDAAAHMSVDPHTGNILFNGEVRAPTTPEPQAVAPVPEAAAAQNSAEAGAAAPEGEVEDELSHLEDLGNQDVSSLGPTAPVDDLEHKDVVSPPALGPTVVAPEHMVTTPESSNDAATPVPEAPHADIPEAPTILTKIDGIAINPKVAGIYEIESPSGVKSLAAFGGGYDSQGDASRYELMQRFFTEHPEYEGNMIKWAHSVPGIPGIQVDELGAQTSAGRTSWVAGFFDIFRKPPPIPSPENYTFLRKLSE